MISSPFTVSFYRRWSHPTRETVAEQFPAKMKSISCAALMETVVPKPDGSGSFPFTCLTGSLAIRLHAMADASKVNTFFFQPLLKLA